MQNRGEQMNTVIGAIFAANALAHVVSFRQIRANGGDNAAGVLAFVFVNAALAVLVGLALPWAGWPALLFPAVGGLGLFTTVIRHGRGTPIDYAILGLDVVTVPAVALFLLG